MGTPFLIGRVLAPQLESASGPMAILGVATLAVASGTLFEGVLVGAAQERVLRQRVSRLRRWSWTFATAAGAGFAWLLGMVPSTILALTSVESTASAPPEPAPAVRLALAVGFGADRRALPWSGSMDRPAPSGYERWPLALGQRAGMECRHAAHLCRHGCRAVARSYCRRGAKRVRRVWRRGSGHRRHSWANARHASQGGSTHERSCARMMPSKSLLCAQRAPECFSVRHATT